MCFFRPRLALTHQVHLPPISRTILEDHSWDKNRITRDEKQKYLPPDTSQHSCDCCSGHTWDTDHGCWRQWTRVFCRSLWTEHPGLWGCALKENWRMEALRRDWSTDTSTHDHCLIVLRGTCMFWPVTECLVAPVSWWSWSRSPQEHSMPYIHDHHHQMRKIRQIPFCLLYFMILFLFQIVY